MSQPSLPLSQGEVVAASWSQFLSGLDALGLGAADQGVIQSVTPMVLVGETLLASVPDQEAKEAVTADLSELIKRELGSLLGCELAALAITVIPHVAGLPLGPGGVAAPVGEWGRSLVGMAREALPS